MAANQTLVSGFHSRLVNRVEVAQGTMAFHFEKPSQFDYRPGQAADVTLTRSEPHGQHFVSGQLNGPAHLTSVDQLEADQLVLHAVGDGVGHDVQNQWPRTELRRRTPARTSRRTP
jgi:hypothetical protein